MLWRRSEPLRRRVALGACVATLAGLVLALADAAWAREGVTNAPGLGTVFAANAGLVLPLCLLVGVVIGVASWLVHPRTDPTIAGMLEQLHEAGTGRPADMAAFAPLCALGLFAWATFSAQLARQLLGSSSSAWLAGATIAAGSLVLGAVIALLVLALTPLLRQKLASWRSSWSHAIEPGATLAIALVLVALLVGVGVATGSVSGEGGMLGIYGILKRQELDLRAPGMLLSLCIACYLVPATMRWLKPYQGALIAVLPLLLTWRAAGAFDRQEALAALIERGAPLGARPLGLLRRLTDRDGDGASATFGGGDCNDADPSIGPGADDIPDNGIDEDCSGTDLSLAGLEPPQPDAKAAAGSNSHVPKNGNVVLITIDTLRHDLGYMGYERKVSPNLDALAERSTVFERAYSLASYTGKSVGPMLIGRYGSETHRNWGHFNKFSKEDTFVAERLAKAGVYTIAVHGHRYFGDWGGLERGFEVLDMSAAPPEDAKWATDNTVTSAALTDAAIRRLGERPKDKPYFLWVHYLDPHADYLQHEGVPSFGSGARALYDNEVAFTDKHIGRLLDALGQDAAADRTSIIVTSDHGEAFGEHKMYRHGVELWEPLVRVPLIVHVPGAPSQRVTVRRSLVDLVPTVLDLMSVPAPDGALSGTSLLPDLFPEKASQPVVRDILVDMPAGPYNEERRAFIHGDLKLIVSGGKRKELFDLASDPDERNNVFRERGKEIEAPYALFKKRLHEIEVTGERK